MSQRHFKENSLKIRTIILLIAYFSSVCLLDIIQPVTEVWNLRDILHCPFFHPLITSASNSSHFYLFNDSRPSVWPWFTQHRQNQLSGKSECHWPFNAASTHNLWSPCWLFLFLTFLQSCPLLHPCNLPPTHLPIYFTCNTMLPKGFHTHFFCLEMKIL